MLSEDGAWNHMGELEGYSSPMQLCFHMLDWILTGLFDGLSDCVNYASDRMN